MIYAMDFDGTLHDAERGKVSWEDAKYLLSIWRF
jgi:hypothetical protein